jgi:hypothetical protein
MDRGVGAAARLPEGDRKDLAIQALAGSETVSDLAARHGVSRKFVHQQTHKARAALDDAFSGVVQIRVTPKTRNPFTIKALSISGVTWKWHFLNHANWLARDIRTLMPWLRQDVLALAGPDLATRRELFDFLVAELAAREPEDPRRIRPVRVALQNQRDDLLAFAGRLDAELADVARAHAVPEPLVREALMLHSLPTTSPAHWQGWNRLRAQLGAKFHALVAAVGRAMADTPRSSSRVENLNSRLRTYFTLRRHLGGSHLELLRFFLNHRGFPRSRHAERRGKSPRELLTGQTHPHWLTLLGLGELQPRRA